MAKRRRTSKGKGKRRFSAKQLANQRRFAAAARARAKAGSSTRTRRKRTMAKRKAKRRPAARAMRSVHRRGGGSVSRAAWRASGYRRNPRRRRTHVRHRRHLRRNPGFSARGALGTGVELLKGTAVTLGGMAVGTKVSALVPIRTANDPTGVADPMVNALKGVIIGIGLRAFGGRFLGPKMAEQAAIGAMLGPLKTLLVTQVPQASSFFSAYAMPTFPAGIPHRLSSYASYSPVTGDDGLDPGAGMGSYAEAWGG